MKKSEILAMDNETLIAHFVRLEGLMVKEVNFKNGLTNATSKDFQWTFDEVCKRFSLDKEKVAKGLDAEFLLEK